MFCHNCGVKLREGSKFCHNCGAKVLEKPVEVKPKVEPIVQPETPQVEPQPLVQEVKVEPVQPEMPVVEKKTNIGLVMGIISVFSPLLGILFGILAIYFSTKKEERHFEAAKILGIIGTIIGVFKIIAFFIEIFTRAL
ncbi:MAG: zinc-ribbon domain-containing protein [Acholeplasmataceae bacterium]|jgi:uncharacterized membrane protein YvbJ